MCWAWARTPGVRRSGPRSKPSRIGMRSSAPCEPGFDAGAFAQVALPLGRRARADVSAMKTYSPKPDHIERRWYVIDAGGHVLGRVATEVATLLRGKHKPMFAPHMDTGDHVIVINADKVELTGNKA